MVFTGPVLTGAATCTELGRDRCHSDVVAVFGGLRLHVSWKCLFFE